MDYELRKIAENKKWNNRSLSEHLSMFRADRPDEWKMDEFIKMAKMLENNIIILQDELNKDK